MSERVSDPFDTLVIGRGIAELTAALFATSSGCSTLVLVPGIPGGQPSPRRARHRDLKRGRSRAGGDTAHELGPTAQTGLRHRPGALPQLRRRLEDYCRD